MAADRNAKRNLTIVCSNTVWHVSFINTVAKFVCVFWLVLPLSTLSLCSLVFLQFCSPEQCLIETVFRATSEVYNRLVHKCRKWICSALENKRKESETRRHKKTKDGTIKRKTHDDQSNRYYCTRMEWKIKFQMLLISIICAGHPDFN